ncbi:hypothetical protein [Roseibacillus persicicus]|uniref:hypothetical protein n=1 Tax=Roseibacillus persicicus TaxID=454148 RepID=UPI00281005FE|nr:hypothetical protein [Roseibacillus persicicus]MDQ8191499.1 hypothetical protein [Roseibacillus persicicus]
MKKLLAAFTLAISLVATAEEPAPHTVKATPFSIKTELSGVLVPTKTQTVLLSPERWKTFPIESVPAHGTEIKAGEPLIVLKTQPIDDNLVEQEAEVKSQELKLAVANRELTELQQKNALALASSKRKMENAEADLAYYESTGLPARKDDIAHSVTQSEDYLKYQKEELTQLLKMYEEDDITEETEEIILVRQKASVRNAEFNLAERKRNAARSLEVTLPRELIGYQEKVENARIAYATAKLNLDRSYELKKLEVAKQERALAKARKALEETQADRKLFDIVAEFDGTLVYGEFKDGVWNKGKTAEFLKKGGSVPTESTVLTLVAKDSPLSVQALVSSEKAEELTKSIAEAGEKAPQVTISSYPNLSGKHLVTLAPAPAEPFQFPGQTEKSELEFYSAEKAITIPSEVLKEREDGTSYVLVKLSEGEPEERTIELGKKDGKVVEVLSGLEEGQVILP